jgi:hypothetical protein
MLTGIKPNRFHTRAYRQTVDRLPVERFSQFGHCHWRCSADARNQIVMPFHRIGSMIGEPHGALRRRMANRQYAVGIARVGLLPVETVVTESRAIIRPTERISGPGAIGDPYRDGSSLGARHAEMEPLVEVAGFILADRERGCVAVNR